MDSGIATDVQNLAAQLDVLGRHGLHFGYDPREDAEARSVLHAAFAPQLPRHAPRPAPLQGPPRPRPNAAGDFSRDRFEASMRLCDETTPHDIFEPQYRFADKRAFRVNR